MKSRIFSMLLIVLFFIQGSACQFTDQTLDGDPLATQTTSDNPFRPLQVTLSAPKDSKLSDSLDGMGEGTSSNGIPAFTGDLDPAISSTTDALLSAINVRRALEGWQPLTRQAALTEIANNRAIDMFVHEYLGHEDPETKEILVEEMLIETGYHGRVAELVYDANEPLDRLAERAITEWFDDPDTCSVLLSPGFHFIGIGIMGDGMTWNIVQVLAEHEP